MVPSCCCLVAKSCPNLWQPLGLSSVGKEYACNTGNLGSIPGSGRSPGEGNGNPLQYSCLGNPVDRGAWWAIVHGGHKESDMSEWLNTHMASCGDGHTPAFSLCCHFLLVDGAADGLCPRLWRQPNLSLFIILVKTATPSLVVWVQFYQTYCFHNKNYLLWRIYAPWCIFFLAASQKFNNSFHTSFFKNSVIHSCLVTKLCPTLCDPMDCSMPGFPVLHCLPGFAQIHVHWLSDAI